MNTFWKWVIFVALALALLSQITGCAVNTITVNQYGPVQVSTGSSNNVAK